MIWPYIALLGISIFWLGLFILLTKWPRSLNKSVSQHAANSKQSFQFFTAIQAPVGIIIFCFMIFWFVPHFQLPNSFTILFSITIWLQILSAFIPDTGEGRKSQLHLWMANSMAAGLYTITVWFCFAPQFSTIGHTIAIVSLLIDTYVAIRIISHGARPDIVPRYLPLQIIGIVSFQLEMLLIAFIE